MNRADRRDWIVARAHALGFDLCGVAPAEDFAELARLPDWLARGYAGQMRYLDDPRRRSPQSVLPGARSLIVCALNYNTPFPYSIHARSAVLAGPGLSPDEKQPARSANLGAGNAGGHGFSRAVDDRRAAPTSLPQAEASSSSSASAPALSEAEGSSAPALSEVEGSSAVKASSPHGWISRYAWGDDYHDVLGKKLDALVTAMRAEFAATPFDARAYVDTGPLHERAAAHHAGLGWLGKNTCLINEHLGSWLFLGVILTTLNLLPSLSSAMPSNGSMTRSPDDPIPGNHPMTRSSNASPSAGLRPMNHPISSHSPLATSHFLPPDLCGQCTQCIDACPTGAIVEPYVLDARRCISYLTIEHRGPIPEEFHAALGWHVFGCDICQDVCPFNRRAPVTAAPEFQPRRFSAPSASSAVKFSSLFAPPLDQLASLSESDFRSLFKNSAIKRTKHAGLSRNAAIALKNGL